MMDGIFFLPPQYTWVLGGREKYPPKNKREKAQKTTKIYEVFMSMNYHSFSLWSPANRSEVWLHVTVAESAGLSWWMLTATVALL